MIILILFLSNKNKMSFFSITFVELENYGKEINRKVLFWKKREDAELVDKFIVDDYADFLEDEWNYLKNYNYLKGEYHSLGIVRHYFQFSYN